MQRPKSVEEIVKEASAFDHKTVYPLRITLRTAQNMLNAAAACERSGNLQDAYLFLYRHAEFCMARVATHPERKQPEFKADITRVTALVKQDLETLERLKPEINKRYERWKQSLARVEAQREKERGFASLEDAKEAGYAQVLDAGEHKELALRLANGEARRRARDPGAEQREFDQLTRNIRDLGRRMDKTDGSADGVVTNHAATFAYPGVHGHQAATLSPRTAPPAIPNKTPLLSDTVPALPPKTPAVTAPEPLASSSYTFRSVATTENGTPLRPLFLPTELRERFLNLAASNTASNLETCGILCGSLISNALFISHLVIPGQTSTSDTCDTTEAGDTALFDYVDSRELMVCGWIHTHPSQTCFLSSRDLHTSVGYQVMMPESVAVVCAPTRDPAYGVFRLTDPPGKQVILACDRTGLFHPHDRGDLYTDALKPGHVTELKGMKFEVVDLRDG